MKCAAHGSSSPSQPALTLGKDVRNRDADDVPARQVRRAPINLLVPEGVDVWINIIEARQEEFGRAAPDLAREAGVIDRRWRRRCDLPWDTPSSSGYQNLGRPALRKHTGSGMTP